MSNGRAFKKSRAATKAAQRQKKKQAKAARGFQRAFSAAASVITEPRTNGMSASIDADALWPGALTVLAGGDAEKAEALDVTPEQIRQVAKEYADADADRG